MKNLWIAYATKERTLNTAEKALLLGLKWAIVLKYSKVCLFFWSGYSLLDSPSITIFVALISKGCLLPGVNTSFPSTIIDELILNFSISLKFSRLSSNTTWRFLKKLPSLTSIKPKALELLKVLIHPEIQTSWSAYFSLSL